MANSSILSSFSLLINLPTRTTLPKHLLFNLKQSQIVKYGAYCDFVAEVDALSIILELERHISGVAHVGR
jgi:hypothetical protein